MAPEQCGKEKRTREYIAKEKFSFGETCDGLVTSCPAAKEETRTICKFIVFVKKSLYTQQMNCICRQNIIYATYLILESTMYKFHSAGMIQSIWYSHKVNVRIGFINYENQMIKNNIFILILIVY